MKNDGLRVTKQIDTTSAAGTQLVGLTLSQPLSEAARIRLRSEGVDLHEEWAVAPFTAFARALKHWPLHIEAEGMLLADAVGIPLELREPSDRSKGGFSPRGRTLVMGVLNVTPDSFYDGGRFFSCDEALRRARQMVGEGADVIDIGGESTRPKAEPVSADEEKRRVIPVVERLANDPGLGVPVSVDTYKADVAEAALKAGARIVNDISGLQFDPDMARVVAAHDAAVVVMHIKGTPKTMQQRPTYTDVVREVREYLEVSCETALRAGVRESKIWIDPGIGFGKTTEHNLTLLRELGRLRSLQFPLLIGTSNKSVIGNVLGLPVTERLEGTAATVALAIANGAQAVRVHDVKAMRRVCDMTDAIVRGLREVPPS